MGREKLGQELFRVHVEKKKIGEKGLRGMAEVSGSKHTIGSFPS